MGYKVGVCGYEVWDMGGTEYGVWGYMEGGVEKGGIVASIKQEYESGAGGGGSVSLGVFQQVHT